MIIDSKKLLPPSKTEEGIKITRKNISTSSFLSPKSIKNIGLIKVKVIQIESILKGTLASEKKALDEKKGKESSQRREKQEEKLETKPNIERGNIKLPQAPKLGIFDWIKNFVGNIILGYFAVRLIKHLPKIMPIVKFLGNAADFIIDVGGKLLNGLVTFVDWGYKAYDATRGFLKNFGGENFAKGFDKFIGAVDTALFLTSVLAADLAIEALTGGDGGGGLGDVVSDQLKRKGVQQVATSAARQAGGTAARAGGMGAGAVAGIVAGAGLLASALGEGAFQLRKVAIKPIQDAKKAFDNEKNPLMKIGRGAYLGGIGLLFGPLSALGVLLDVVGAPFRYAIELLRYPFLSEKDKEKQAYNLAKFDSRIREDFRKALNLVTLGFAFREKGSFGNIYGNKGSQKEMMGKMAGGGITRGGKTQGRATRTISKGKKGKYKRKLAPQKPGKVEINSPGADVGGEDKIFGIFPNPLKGAQKVFDAMNPFNTIKRSGEELGQTDYFGPILAITAKLLTGQKPNQQDYKNVGLGINLLVAKGIQDKQLKGGIVAAFAEGGLVDPEVLSAMETGGDISNWVAKTFQGEIETNAQKTLRLIKENAEKKKQGDAAGYKSTTEEDLPSGTGSLVGNTNAEKVFNYLTGYGFTEQAAAGVIGNLMQESGVNPLSKQLGGGPGRGIMQWGTGPGSGGRWDALVAWASSSGKDPWKLDTQVEWMMKEMKSYGTLNRLKGETNVKRAVEIFEREMEKAGTPNYPRRYQFASDALASFGKGKAGGIGVNRGALGGSVIEYITGDPNTPVGRYDRAGHGLSSNYHDHIAFRTIQDKEKAKRLLTSSGIKIGSEYRPGDPGYHGQNLAIDVPGYQWGGKGSIGQIEFSGSKKVRNVLGLTGGGGKGGTSMKEYHTGTDKINSKETMAKLLKKESVLDVDTSESLRKIDPQLIGQLNRATSPAGIMKILQSYATYEDGAEQTVVVIDSPSTNVNIDDNYGDISPSLMFMGGEEESDPFATLYRGG